MVRMDIMSHCPLQLALRFLKADKKPEPTGTGPRTRPVSDRLGSFAPSVSELVVQNSSCQHKLLALTLNTHSPLSRHSHQGKKEPCGGSDDVLLRLSGDMYGHINAGLLCKTNQYTKITFIRVTLNIVYIALSWGLATC